MSSQQMQQQKEVIDAVHSQIFECCPLGQPYDIEASIHRDMNEVFQEKKDLAREQREWLIERLCDAYDVRLSMSKDSWLVDEALRRGLFKKERKKEKNKNFSKVYDILKEVIEEIYEEKSFRGLEKIYKDTSRRICELF